MKKGESLASWEHVRINRGASAGAIVTSEHKVPADQDWVWIRGKFDGEFLYGRLNRRAVSKLALNSDGTPVLFGNVADMKTYAEGLDGADLDRVGAELKQDPVLWESLDDDARRTRIFTVLYDASRSND